MAGTLHSERQKSTKSSVSETQPIDQTDKTHVRSPRAQRWEEQRNEGKKRDGFEDLQGMIRDRCHLINNAKERRDTRKKLWHLARIDTKKFNALIDIGYVDPKRLAKLRARQQAEQAAGEKDEDEDRAYTPPEQGDSSPCLQCSLKGGMPCSAQLKGWERAVRCQRCRRNGEAFCVRQRENLVQPVEEHHRLDLARAARGEEEYLTRRVYCYDKALRKDRPRLCAVTLELLRRFGYLRDTNVCGTLLPVRQFHGGGNDMVLPVWHDNDQPANRRDLEYHPWTHVDYFAKIQAGREKKLKQVAAMVGEKREADETERLRRRET